LRFGICVYKDDIPAAERAGYDYVELTVTNVWPEVGDDEYRRLKEYLKQFKVKPEAWRRFVPPSLSVVGPKVDFPQITEFLHNTLSRIRDLGGEVVVFGSPLSRNVPEGFSRERAHEQILQFLRTCSDIAKKNELVIVIEPIIRRNCNFLNTVAEALHTAREIEDPQVRVLADLYHMWGNDEPTTAVEQKSLRVIGYDRRLSIEDLDRKFMNLEREAPIVLAHVRQTWEDLSA